MHLPLLNAPLIELLKIWGDLIECLHDENGYGGTDCEIYEYRLQGRSPIREDNIRQAGWGGADQNAADALQQLCQLFCDEYRCNIYLMVGDREQGPLVAASGHGLPLLERLDANGHRYHLRVTSA